MKRNEISFFHKFVKKMTVYLSIFSILMGMTVFSAPAAFAEVSAIVMNDVDISGFGINGNDFNINWNPGTQPEGYIQTSIYLVKSANIGTGVAQINVASPSSVNTACTNVSGGVCIPVGFFNNHNQISFTLPQSVVKDSNNEDLLATNSYEACILTTATTNSLVCSSVSFSPTSDAPTDTLKPVVTSIPVHTHKVASQAYIFAIITDNQTSGSEFANGTDGGAEYMKLFYRAGSSGIFSSVEATSVAGDLFKFSIPNTDPAVSASSFEYYIEASDRIGNVRFFCANPAATTSLTCSPFTVNNLADNTTNFGASISGATSSSGSPLASVSMLAGGYSGLDVVTTGMTGTFSLTGLPKNSSVDVQAIKPGYCPAGFFLPTGTGAISDIFVDMIPGTCFFTEGGGKPHVTFSGPPEGSFGFPLDQDLRVGFDQPLNQSTVNAADATDAGSKVYLTTDDGTTKVAGSVTYCATAASPGCSSIPMVDTNTILFQPASDLTVNTTYTLVITKDVLGENGHQVEGNGFNGGHRISFSTGGGTFTNEQITTNFGTAAGFMPPWIEAMLPGPGITAAPNAKFLLRFNEAMNESTITSTNIKLIDLSDDSEETISLLLDQNEKRNLLITPSTSLAVGDYEIRVLGAVANNSGVAMMPMSPTGIAFAAFVPVSGSDDTAPPNLTPEITDGSTGVAVNIGSIRVGFSEQMAPGTLTSSNITLQRGSSNVAIKLKYKAGSNELVIIPESVLAPNTSYTLTFGTGITDLNGNALTAAQTYGFSTDGADNTAPRMIDLKCDVSQCVMFFNEPMLSTAESAGAVPFAKSVLNIADNLTLQIDTGGGFAAVNKSGINANYIYEENILTLNNMPFVSTDLSMDGTIIKATWANVTDLSSNVIDGNNDSFQTLLKSLSATGGSLFDQGEMFKPGAAGSGQTAEIGGGKASVDQKSAGQFNFAFPFNNVAGQDSNVFQVNFVPYQAVQDGDIIELTFPNGTGVSNAKWDEFSPFKSDMNQIHSGTITFDTTYNEDIDGDASADAGGKASDGVAADPTTRKVRIKLDVSGTPGSSDGYTIDLRGITNPSIAKGPDTGGYTVGIKLIREDIAVVDESSIPYFITAGGSNTITVKAYAGSTDGVSGANGDLFMFAGGPAGPMDKNLTLTNGKTTAADGTTITGDAGVVYSNLSDGCYFFGTEPFVSLGGVDYFGQQFPEPLCVSGGQSKSKNLMLTSAESEGSSVAVTVKFSTAPESLGNMCGKDIDIFAGGPGNFVVKTITGMTTPDASGYTVRIPSSGHWFIGVGPAMPKNAGGVPPQLPCSPPEPVDIQVNLTGDSISQGFFTPEGVTVNPSTKTITIICATADKTFSGTVKDGLGTNLAGIEVFVHGFGMPAFTKTASDGTFSVSVGRYGTYEIGVNGNGMKPFFDRVEIKPDGSDAGTADDIFFRGKQITGTNPFVLKLKKPSYSISGKLLDNSGNAISYAPLFATNSTTGEFLPAGTDSNGEYLLFVDAGTWVIKADLPTGKTDDCGTFSKTVTITTESKTSQNIRPSTSTCITVSGTVTIDGSVKGNVPLGVESWNTTTDSPTGTFRPGSTNSSGFYQVKVPSGSAYRACTFSPDFGEVCEESSGSLSTDTTLNLTRSLGAVTINFTGGTSAMKSFIELKNADDEFTRKGEPKNGLDTAFTASVPILGGDSDSYEYFVDVFGVGKYTGTVTTGSSATIDLSAADLKTLTINVEDTDTDAQDGVLVKLKNLDTGAVDTCQTDSNGSCTINVQADDNFTVTTSKAGYMTGGTGSQEVDLSDDATVNFTGANALVEPDTVVEGTVYEEGGTTPVSDGFVQASVDTDADGDFDKVITAPIDSSGNYSLPLEDGTYTVEAKTPGNDPVTTTVTVAGSDVSDEDLTATADSTRNSSSKSSQIDTGTGGTVNDLNGDTDAKITAGGGVLGSSGDADLTIEQSYTAPDTSTDTPLGDVAYDIDGSSNSQSQIKETNGNYELQFDYTDIITGDDTITDNGDATLTITGGSTPITINEADLSVKSLNQAAGDYIECEGGVSVDTTNDIITCQVDHFSTFAITYSPAVTTTTTPTPTPTPSPSGGGGGSGSLLSLGDSSDSEDAEAEPAPVVSESTTLAEEVVNESKEVSGATETAFSLQDAETKAFMTLPAGVTVTVKGEDGEVEVKVVLEPPKTVALEGPTKVPSDAAFKSLVYEFGNGSDSLEFDKPVTLSIPVTVSDLAETLKNFDLNVYYLDEASGEWMLVGACKATTLGEVNMCEIEVTHTTKYAVFESEKVVVEEEGAETVAAQTPFEDTFEHWARNYIADLYNKGIVNGYDAKHYGPDQSISRAEFTKIAINAFSIAVLSEDKIVLMPFVDVNKGDWFLPYVKAALVNKIVGGFEDGSFRPGQAITRAEAVKVLLEASGADVSGASDAGFSDVSAEDWFANYVNYAAANGIVKGYGDNTFGPDKALTRAEVAKIVSLMLEMELIGADEVMAVIKQSLS
ncbi:S-layer homology domain-containing protein [Candidatus Peregrinibacteria bacterium]|nr:S-layer homology domain-containing protein [Candidatus Peregrinibacteria bacterium]